VNPLALVRGFLVFFKGKTVTRDFFPFLCPTCVFDPFVNVRCSFVIIVRKPSSISCTGVPVTVLSFFPLHLFRVVKVDLRFFPLFIAFGRSVLSLDLISYTSWQPSIPPWKILSFRQIRRYMLVHVLQNLPPLRA